QAARSLRVEAQELHGEAERRRVAINRALAGARSVARHAHQSSPLRPCGRPHSPVGARPRNAAAALRPPAKAAADRPAAGALTDVAATTRPRRRWRAPAGWQAAGSHGRTTLRAAPRESPDAWAPAWRLPDAARSDPAPLVCPLLYRGQVNHEVAGDQRAANVGRRWRPPQADGPRGSA